MTFEQDRYKGSSNHLANAKSLSSLQYPRVEVRYLVLQRRKLLIIMDRRIIEPSIGLPKNKEKLESTEIMDCEFKKGNIKLGEFIINDQQALYLMKLPLIFIFLKEWYLLSFSKKQRGLFYRFLLHKLFLNIISNTPTNKDFLNSKNILR